MFPLHFSPRFEEAGAVDAGGGGAPASPSTSASTSTSASSSGASGSSSGSLSLDIGSLENFLLGSDSDDSSTDETSSATSTPAAEPSESEEAETSTQEEETASQQSDPAAKDTASESEWDPEVGAPNIIKDAKGKDIYQWPKERGQRIYQGYKAAQQYQEVAPTVEDARAHQAAFIEKENMVSDWASGDPGRVENFLAYLQRTSPQGMVTAAKVLASELPQANPEAYRHFESSILTSKANSFYQDAKKLLTADPNSQDGAKYLFAAQTLDYLMGKPFRDVAQVSLPTEPDPREAELAAREAKLREAEQTTATREWQNYAKQVSKDLDHGVKSIFEETLTEPLKALKDAKPKMYERAVKELRDAVTEGMAADTAFKQMYDLRANQLKANRTPDAAKALKTQYLGRVRIEATKRAAAIIKDYTDAFVAQNVVDNAKAKKAASRTEVQSGAGASGSKGLAVNDQKFKEARTMDEKMNAIFGLV